MSVSFTEDNGVLIVMPGKRLDTNTAPEAETELTAKIEAGKEKIVVDFGQTEYISSAGLRVILKTAKLLKPKNGKVVLCNANEQINEVLEVSGFLSMMKCHASLDAAVQDAAA